MEREGGGIEKGEKEREKREVNEKETVKRLVTIAFSACDAILAQVFAYFSASRDC